MGPGLELLDSGGWLAPPAERAAPVAGNVRCHAVVVGGGLAGLSAALRLARAGRQVALVESDFCGAGASSRNAGHLSPTIAGDPRVLLTVHRRRARRLLAFAEAAVAYTEEVLDGLGASCDYVRAGNLYAAIGQRQVRASGRLAARLADLGADVCAVGGEGVIGVPVAFRGGVFERRGGHLDPGKLVRTLRAVALDAGVRLFEDSAVLAVRDEGGAVVVTTARGQVRADRALVATNAYVGDLGLLPARAVRPVWVTVAETEPLDDACLNALGWTSRAGVYTQHLILESYRPTARGTVVFGTRQVQAPGRPARDRRPDPEVVREIVRGLHARIPALVGARVERAWGGWIAMTPNWLPRVGAASPRVTYAVGFNGHGLAQAPYAGHLLAGHALGERHDDLSTLWNRPQLIPPQPFTAPAALRAGWLLDRASDAARGTR